MQVSFVNVPLPGSIGRVPGVLYSPAPGAEVAGIVIMAPGSNGGTGPGLEKSREGLALAKSQTALAYGSIYRRLGLELTNVGVCYDWRGRPIQPSQGASSSSSGRSTSRSEPVMSKPAGTPRQRAVAALHISWRHTHNGKQWPRRRLKLVRSLEIAANDFVAGVHYMRASFGMDLPVVLVGFSFGGPAAWSAASKLVKHGMPPVGVVAMAGSCRDGPAFQELGLDTLGCAATCRKAGVSSLLIHGTADENVDIDVSQYFYSNLQSQGDASLNLAAVAGSAHMFDFARDVVFDALKGWVSACLYGLPGSLVGPYDTGAVAMQLRGGGRIEPVTISPIERDILLQNGVKGYSEKVSSPLSQSRANAIALEGDTQLE